RGLRVEVEDVERWGGFYLGLRGVVLEHHRPGEFALLRIGEAWLGLIQLGARGFHLELTTPDLDRLYAHLRRKGLKPGGPPKERSWGERTFLLIDPDGNRIEFQ